MVEVAPLSLLRQINYRTGARLPKFPALPKPTPIVFPPVVMGPHNRIRANQSIAIRFSDDVKVTLADKVCNFEHWEYRFWRVELNANRTGITNVVCRACQEILLTKTGRERHKEMKGCYQTLVEAYRLLLADQICVICNAATTQRRWGLPMCSMRCEEQWLHEVDQPEALSAAILLAEMNKRGR